MNRRGTKKLKPQPFKPDVGTKYRVLGYHTGDFAGQCVQVFKLTAVFQVVEKKVGSALELGQLIEVPLFVGGGIRFGRTEF
jgi:hypothetical protein